MTAKRRAAIIGAGQGGLHLGHGLLTDGWDVTIMSDRTPAQYLQMGILSGHTLQYRSVEMERDAGIELYDSLIDVHAVGVNFSLTMDGNTVVQHFLGDFERPATAMDSRLKYASELTDFERRGGSVVYRTATVDDLEQLTERGDSVFVATGKGELSSLFDLDESRTTYDRPQRRLIALTVDGAHIPSDLRDRISFCFFPGVGEIFYSTSINKDNREMVQLLLEAVPDGPMDRMDEAVDGPSGLALAQELFTEFASWAAPVVESAQLTDPKAVVRGALRPCVRHPVATLPSGRTVYGLGDVLTVLDPAAGQGGNCTVRGTHHLLGKLRELSTPTFDRHWYEQQVEEFWQADGQYFVQFANMLIEPPGGPARHILAQAEKSRAVADRFGSTFADPKVLMAYVGSLDAAQQFVEEAEAGLRAELPSVLPVG